MGSLAPFVRLLLPRAGAVPPNAAIVLEAYVHGEMTIAARVGGEELRVTVEKATRLSYDRFGGPGSFYLVRPTTAEWPIGSTVVLTVARAGAPSEDFEVGVDQARDVTAPAFSSLTAPTARTLSDPSGDTKVVALDHGPFDDVKSPIVLVRLELGGAVHTGVVLEGRAGTLTMQPLEELRHVDAITLTDVAGNSCRIVQPCEQRPPEAARPDLEAIARSAFDCVAGGLTAVNGLGAFLATTDGGSEEGFSRGHYLSTQPADGDLEVTVTATRLTDEHEMPIEIAFHGGFFGVTGNSSWYLYEHPGHWTGWQPTASPVGKGQIELRVVQRGARVSGYVNDTLAGSFVLEKPAPVGPVGIFFKGRPGSVARMRFRDFAVRPFTVDPLEQPCSVTLLVGKVDEPADLEAISIEERRTSWCTGWETFPIRSGRLLDVFVLKATNSDLAVTGLDPVDDNGTMLATSFIDGVSLCEVLAKIEHLVEGDATATLALLRAHDGATADPARLAAALHDGQWPDSGDAAEEAAAFAFHLLAHARRAVEQDAGVCIEHRGALRL